MIIDDNLRSAIVAAAIEIEEHPGELYVDEITEIIVRHIKAVKAKNMQRGDYDHFIKKAGETR